MDDLVVLAVDDERPALDELCYLLERQDAVGTVLAASDATGALRELNDHRIDAIFLDINMPGLSGLELAGVLGRYTEPPAIVFVTAHDDKAVDAFEVGALDYLLKPLREDRLAQAVDRVTSNRDNADSTPQPQSDNMTGTTDTSDEVIPVEMSGVTSLVRRDSISWVEAVGDYARLHADSGAHLVRIPMSTLESRWQDHGFARVHRSYLVALKMVTGLRTSGSTTVVSVGENGRSPAVELPVSRRQLREIKDRIIRDPLRTYRSGEPGGRT
ncbi:LytTR family DNA-binding domain-containing protein [Gordonia sp. ABSL49_1]|uniref:LytR/AlgR family response regulator transcription factor n=1 Tax=unclassified Gordonia (in: high G+C Gram-positive bacteria) TaxID=2657482 RepID=UPI001F0D8E74|nr:LytTR family DNA-binding domain-containing protein [Gordonia sp. ABSL49_1]MCH5644041.1 LytTR family DNA-binding domain-containing protein [Gordonia sp. ABSL49_1]